MAFASNTENLRRHLTALKAAARLLRRQPDEAAGSARRIAQVLARQEGDHPDIAAMAARLEGVQGDDLADDLKALIAMLDEAIVRESAPGGVVLLVEDDPELVKLFTHALGKAGWEVASAATAAEARSVVERRDVSAIVLDLMLPDTDGRNLLLQLKEQPQSAAIPVLVASAHADPHVKAECLALGATDFLKKPLKPRKLLDLLARRARPSSPADPSDPAVAVRLADRVALSAAFRATGGGNRALALVGPAQPDAGPGSGRTPLEDIVIGVGAGLTAAVGDDGLVARHGEDELAVLFRGGDREPFRILEQARQDLRARQGQQLDFVAGLVSLTEEMSLEEATDDAGRLLYSALGSPGGRVLCDLDEVVSPNVRVLLAEDDPLTAKLLIYRLTREPAYQVTHCIDGAEALAAVREEQYDIALLDINMPGLDGFDLLARMRAMPRYRRTPIAILTALGGEQTVIRGLELGANDYIIKPFSPSEVIARMRRLLGRSVRGR